MNKTFSANCLETGYSDSFDEIQRAIDYIQAEFTLVIKYM